MREIPPFRLIAQPLTDEAEAAAGFAHANPDVGTRHRLGGPAPCDDADIPTCPSCPEPMTFYGQLDSIGDEIVLADAGVVAVFVCFDCLQTTAMLVTT